MIRDHLTRLSGSASRGTRLQGFEGNRDGRESHVSVFLQYNQKDDQLITN